MSVVVDVGWWWGVGVDDYGGLVGIEVLEVGVWYV